MKRPVARVKLWGVLGLALAASATSLTCTGHATASRSSSDGTGTAQATSPAAATTSTVNSTPSGPPTPPSGWHVDLADGFNAPLGTGRGMDNFWYPSQSWNGDLAQSVDGNNPYETEVYNSRQVTVEHGDLVLTARYQKDVAPATGGRVQRNYVSGIVSSPTNRPGYKGFNWTPGDGSTWAFEIDCRFPVNTGELFNAWWSSSQGTWVDERDFVEGKGSGLDTDWIYRTVNSGGHLSDYYTTHPAFKPAAAMHRYTYLINPNGSWSVYIDGVLQTWVGNRGVAPPQGTTDTPMELLIDYAMVATTFSTGTRAFTINSVAVYQDNAHAGRTGVTGGGVAPGTTVTQVPADQVPAARD